MASQTESGTGISWKLPDGTMIWVKRDTWAQVAEDIRIIKGEAYLNNIEAQLKGGGAAPPVVQQAAPPTPPTEPTLTPEQVAEELGGGTVSPQTFAVCPACGQLKNKLVPAGFSKRTQKNYPAFYVCQTPGCPGK